MIQKIWFTYVKNMFSEQMLVYFIFLVWKIIKERLVTSSTFVLGMDFGCSRI